MDFSRPSRVLPSLHGGISFVSLLFVREEGKEFCMDRNLIRDSGVHQPDESLAEEDPNITIREGDNSSDSSSVHSHSSSTDMPDNDPPAQVRPQQVANIPLFDGERGESFTNWLETLENTRDAYDWPVDSLVGVAKTRGGPRIAEWLRGQRLQGTTYLLWGTDAGLRKALQGRFGPKFTSATAVHAVSDLKQRGTESCADFMDRVLLAVDRMHFAVTEADKAQAGYQRVFTSSSLMHFGAGVRPEIGKVILGRAVAPATVAERLTAAEAVEAELSKKGAPGSSALTIASSDDSIQPTSELEELAQQVENLTEAVSAIASASKKPFDFTKIKCYRCGEYGHFQNRCTNKTRRSAGPNRRLPNTTRRGVNQAFRRPSRAQFALEEEEDAENSGEEEDPQDPEDPDLQWTSGN